MTKMPPCCPSKFDDEMILFAFWNLRKATSGLKNIIWLIRKPLDSRWCLNYINIIIIVIIIVIIIIATDVDLIIAVIDIIIIISSIIIIF